MYSLIMGSTIFFTIEEIGYFRHVNQEDATNTDKPITVYLHTWNNLKYLCNDFTYFFFAAKYWVLSKRLKYF